MKMEQEEAKGAQFLCSGAAGAESSSTLCLLRRLLHSARRPKSRAPNLRRGGSRIALLARGSLALFARARLRQSRLIATLCLLQRRQKQREAKTTTTTTTRAPTNLVQERAFARPPGRNLLPAASDIILIARIACRSAEPATCQLFGASSHSRKCR